MSGPKPTSAIARLMGKFRIDGNECWTYAGATTDKGYGLIWEDGRHRLAHRVSYEHFVGPIPEGHHLDHLCRNRACVNSAHLEPVTVQENLLRGETLAATNAAKSHCWRGHPFDEANTYVDRRGSRTCITCRTLRKAEYRARAAA